MTHRIALSAAWMSVACALVLLPGTASSAAGSDGCELGARSTHPVVADRVERAIERCARNVSTPEDVVSPVLSLRAVVLAECVSAARRDGFRTADRLEHDIEMCLTERIDEAGTPQ